MTMLVRTLALPAPVLAAISVFGGPSTTYTGCGEIPAGQNLETVTFHETVVAGDF